MSQAVTAGIMSISSRSTADYLLPVDFLDSSRREMVLSSRPMLYDIAEYAYRAVYYAVWYLALIAEYAVLAALLVFAILSVLGISPWT